MATDKEAPEAFYQRLDVGRFAPTLYTRGPWDMNSQHAGPPAALLGLAVQEHQGARPDMRLTRIGFEIIRPVPIKPLTVQTRVLRAGRTVELIEASLAPEGGTEVMRATALRIRMAPGSVPEVADGPAIPGPEESVQRPFFPVAWDDGYHTAMDVRFASGSFTKPGPAKAWMRMRVPLIAGENIAPLSRAVIAADSVNGVSSALDYHRYVFINADLTVYLHRHPVGEWVCVDAHTSVNAAGFGVADGALHDEKGPIGRTTQSLYVAPRN